MSAGKGSKLHATTRSESTLRGIVLVMALTVLLVPEAAWADTVVLDSGTLTLDVVFGGTFRQFLSASGPDFVVGAGGFLGFAGPGCEPCLPGSFAPTHAGGTGADSGIVTYAGVNYIVSEIGFFGACVGSPPVVAVPRS